jgi:hypothetical protein
VSGTADSSDLESDREAEAAEAEAAEAEAEAAEAAEGDVWVGVSFFVLFFLLFSRFVFLLEDTDMAALLAFLPLSPFTSLLVTGL